MKFFTTDWHSGKLPERESGAVPIRYTAHIGSLLSRFPATVRTLAQGVNLHDGLIRSVTVDRTRQALELQFRCGDREVGYFDLALVYSRVRMEDLDLSELKAIAEDPKSEALYDEVDVGNSGAWAHRILFWPYREIVIEFGALGLQLDPRNGRAFPRTSQLYVERTNKTG
jgi:hypothetical protein